jgi:small GTP-binding protein
MPTNLPPEAADAEKRYRAAKTTADKITTLEEYISMIPKHKGTDKLRASLRKRLSKLKSSTQGKKTSKQETAFHVEKEGAGQVVVIGSSNSGKSSLVSTLTHAKPLVSQAPFSTWTATPGMMTIENIQVQLVDTPPLNRDFVEPELIELVRLSDMVLFVVDLQTDPLNQFENTLELLKNHRIIPSVKKESIIEKDRINFLPFIILANKCDDENYDENFEIFCELLEDNWIILPISIAKNRNLEKIKDTVFEVLEIMRVYSKAHGRNPDLDDPFVLKKGSTVEEFAGKVHHDFTEKLKTARIWGKGVHDGQMVGRDHVLQDEDVVELHV